MEESYEEIQPIVNGKESMETEPASQQKEDLTSEIDEDKVRASNVASNVITDSDKYTNNDGITTESDEDNTNIADKNELNVENSSGDAIKQATQDDSTIKPESTDLKEENSELIENGDAANEGNSELPDDGWTYVLGHDKLKLKVLRPGDSASRPVHGQVVTVRCCGELDDGTKVDQADQLTFTVGDGDVITAFDLCIAMMQLNQLSQIVTDAKYAYGAQGRKPDVPPNANITYEVELLKVEDAPDVTSLPITEKIKLGDAKRERGNFWYTRNDYSAAITSYTKALRLLDETNIASEPADLIQQLTDMRMKCYNNMAAAQLKVEAWDAGIKSCESVLKSQLTNSKALFRRGKCYAAKGDLEKAISSLREAIKYEPQSKLIHNELSRLVKKNKVQTQSRKEMYQRMLGTEKEETHEKQKKGSSLWYYGGTATAMAVVLAGIAYRYFT